MGYTYAEAFSPVSMLPANITIKEDRQSEAFNLVPAVLHSPTASFILLSKQTSVHVWGGLHLALHRPTA